MAPIRRLAALGVVVALAGCGGSSTPKPPRGGPTLRLTIPIVQNTLDPAKVADLPSLNVAHELYAGLTRFSGRGVVPDLAESWEPSEDGLVWTFHLRKNLRWSDDRPITAEDFRRSWLHALAPGTHSAYARAEMQNIRGARRYRATGSGAVGVEAVDDRTLRVTLQHPVPWLDEQVAWPVFFPVPPSGRASSGPFRLVSHTRGRVVLERNFNYWNVAVVKPKRIVLTTSTNGVDGILPRGLAAPGFPWIETAPTPPLGKVGRSTLALGFLWFLTDDGWFGDPDTRRAVAWSVSRLDRELPTFVPQVMPGAATIDAGSWRPPQITAEGLGPLTLAYTTQDVAAAPLAMDIRDRLREDGINVTLRPVGTLPELLRLAGPPGQPRVDMMLLGWSSEFFDEYNILDLFPCASALNVAHWCDRSYDRLMRRAVRTLDDHDRWEIERQLVAKLNEALPAVPVSEPAAHASLEPGVSGFSWSPIGFYELAGMTRS
jgi:oligopeptide transport system substrate-binding protein